MMLWAILTAMLLVAAVGLTIPLVRRYDARRSGGGALGVLQAQLADIDAQASSGSLSPEEAQGLRAEVRRRALAEGGEGEKPPRPIGESALLPLVLGLALIVVLGATGLYFKIGRPDIASAPSAVASAGDTPTGQEVANPHPGGDPTAMIGQLEAKLKDAPNDPEGWRMLGWSYMQTARYPAAAAAYARAAALDPRGEYLSAEGEALVQAGGGQVTPDALTAFRKAVAADPADPRARYFLAVDKDQHGDHKGAMADWLALLKSAPPNAPWANEVRGFVQKIAKERGLDIAAQLPPAPADAPGPTADQVAAAGRLPAGDQQAMIQTMVEGLASRLKASPRDPDGWVRLMRARMVLNQPDAAEAAYRDAVKTYADTPAQQAAFKDAARSLGVPGV